MHASGKFKEIKHDRLPLDFHSKMSSLHVVGNFDRCKLYDVCFNLLTLTVVRHTFRSLFESLLFNFWEKLVNRLRGNLLIWNTTSEVMVQGLYDGLHEIVWFS